MVVEINNDPMVPGMKKITCVSRANDMRQSWLSILAAHSARRDPDKANNFTVLSAFVNHRSFFTLMSPVNMI